MLSLFKQMVYKSLEFFLNTKLGLIAFLVLMLIPAGMLYKILIEKHPSSFTVMITNINETSGGSGSVIKTAKDHSYILTNSHICNVIKGGGIVKKEDGSKFMATSFIASGLHDLCIIEVAADLGQSVKIADVAPKLYSQATITGHPSLLPAIISGGKFGDRKIIEVMTELKPCTEKDIRKSPENALICIFIGGIPVIKSYESIVVSAMIMGGSSGSAVLNDKGELAGVVFAGQGKGLSYAFIVPWEYVSLFVSNQDPDAMYFKLPMENQEEIANEALSKKVDIKKACKKENLNKKQEEICSIFNRNLIWENENGK